MSNSELCVILKLFQISGLAPYFIGKDYEHTKRSRPLVAYNLLLTIMALFISHLNERFGESDAYINKSFLLSISYTLVYVLKNIHPSLVSAKCLIHVNSSVGIWFKIKRINKKLKKLNVEFDQNKFKIYLYVKTGVFVFSSLIFHGSDMVLNNRIGIYHTVNYWAFCGFISIYNLIIETAFGALVLIVYQRFWVINKFLNQCTEYKNKREGILFTNSFVRCDQLENFESSSKSKKSNFCLCDRYLTQADSTENSCRKNFPLCVMMKNSSQCFGKDFDCHSDILKTMQSLKKIHFELFEVTNNLNSIFGWNVVFIFATSFFESIINIFFIIVFHLRTFDAGMYLSCALWTTVYLFKILYFVAYSNKVYKEVRRTVYLLYLLSIKTQFSDVRIRAEIKAFCLQLKQCEVRFTASKFFTIDPALLFQFVVGVLSSVAFIVQFDKINLYEK